MDRFNGKKRIAIIGTGLIGGSLGLALKAARLPGLEIIGHDSDRSAPSPAAKLGAIDRAEHNLQRAVEGAGMVIIAVPVLTVREVMRQIAPHMTEGVVVTDTTSTKAHVMRWAKESLPEYVHFVGGHPLAGKGGSGIANAQATLFPGEGHRVCPAAPRSSSPL